MVFQDFRLLDHLTTYENVALPLRVRGKEEASYRAEVTELLHWVGLGERMHILPPVLSGGEKQRAAIARALIVRPELLLADEPTGNVDPSLARRLLRLFTELHKTGTSVVIATHDLGLMDQFDAPAGWFWATAASISMIEAGLTPDERSQAAAQAPVGFARHRGRPQTRHEERDGACPRSLDRRARACHRGRHHDFSCLR